MLRTLGQKSSNYPKINIFKISFLTNFSISKPHFSQNSHFPNLIIHKIHLFWDPFIAIFYPDTDTHSSLRSLFKNYMRLFRNVQNFEQLHFEHHLMEFYQHFQVNMKAAPLPNGRIWTLYIQDTAETQVAATAAPLATASTTIPMSIAASRLPAPTMHRHLSAPMLRTCLRTTLPPFPRSFQRFWAPVPPAICSVHPKLRRRRCPFFNWKSFAEHKKNFILTPHTLCKCIRIISLYYRFFFAPEI